MDNKNIRKLALYKIDKDLAKFQQSIEHGELLETILEKVSTKQDINFNGVTLKGDKPEYGVDYLTPDEIQSIKEELTPIFGIDYFTDEQIKKVASIARPVYGKDYLTKVDIANIKNDLKPVVGKDYVIPESYVPKVGIDYFTEKDIAKIVKNIKSFIPKEVDLVKLENSISYKVEKKILDKVDSKLGGIENNVDINETIIELNKKDKVVDWKVLKNIPYDVTSGSKGGKTIHRGGPGQFTQLDDTPKSYVGQSGKIVKVKTDESGLEFGSSLETQNLQAVTDIGATTTNNITVNSLTETVPTLLRIDQTTPQTTLGTLTFPNLNITGSTVTVGDVTGTPSGTWTYDDAGAYFDYGQTDYAIRVYAYKNIEDGTKVFSTNYAQSDFTSDPGNDDQATFYFTWSWNAVSGADGYRVTINNPDTAWQYTYYQDVATNTFIDAIGPWNWQANPTPLATPTSAYTYSHIRESLDIDGKLIVGQTITSTEEITSPTVNVTDGTNSYKVNGQTIMRFVGTTGIINQYFGIDAGSLSTSVNHYGNTGVGGGVLNALTTGFGNTVNGNSSASALTTQSLNTISGYNTLSAVNAGGANSLFGAEIGKNATGIGSNNLVGGVSAIYQAKSGSLNVILGAYAGYNLDGDNNIIIGPFAGYRETGDNKLIIDYTNRADMAGEKANAIVWGQTGLLANQTLRFNAKVGINIDPTAYLTLPAGSATADTAPIKFTSGTLTTAAVNGQVEYLSGKFYIRGTEGWAFGAAGQFINSANANYLDYNATTEHRFNNNISLLGTSARSIYSRRHTTANTAGNDLNIQGGGATSGATDKDGGMVVIAPGLSTGTGKGSIRVKRLGRASATGTTDNALYDAHVIGAEKVITAEGSVNLFEIALPAGGMTGGTLTFQIMATDGTDFQVHTGKLNFAAVNKAGTYTSQITDEPVLSDADAGSLGTISDTWAITAGTNKITISVTVACSLIVANDIRIYWTLHNGGRNDVTQL